MEARGLRQRTAGAETARSIWGAASGSAELAWGCGLRRAKGCRKRLGPARSGGGPVRTHENGPLLHFQEFRRPVVKNYVHLQLNYIKNKGSKYLSVIVSWFHYLLPSSLLLR